MTQILKGNWLVVSNLILGIWQKLIQALESLEDLHVNMLIMNEVYNVWDKKGTDELCFMTLKSD